MLYSSGPAFVSLFGTCRCYHCQIYNVSCCLNKRKWRKPFALKIPSWIGAFSDILTISWLEKEVFISVSARKRLCYSNDTANHFVRLHYVREVKCNRKETGHIRQDLRLFLCFGPVDTTIAKYFNAPCCLNKQKWTKSFVLMVSNKIIAFQNELHFMIKI